MASVNTDTLNQAVRSFQKLPVNEQIAVLATFYQDMGNALSAPSSGVAATSEVRDLVKQVRELRQEHQLQFIQDVFSEQKNDQESIALDPHPSKALLELTPGATKPPISSYNHFSPEARLAFWYLLARELGSDTVSLATSTQLSQPATELLSSLQASEFEQQINFIRRVV